MVKASIKRQQPTLKNPDRICVVCQRDYVAVSPLQKTCSLDCRKKLWDSNSKTFRGRNPHAMKEYNQNRLKKNPDAWKQKTQAERLEIIKLLGGKCIACGVSNTSWLHIDYVPTMKGTGFRHPRHKKWVIDNIKNFRILCANHHYELTITGKIQGTSITQ